MMAGPTSRSVAVGSLGGGMQECHHATRPVRHDDHDAALRAPSQSFAGQEFAPAIKQNCARRRIVDIDAQLDPLRGGAVLDFQGAAPDAQGGIRA